MPRRRGIRDVGGGRDEISPVKIDEKEREREIGRKKAKRERRNIGSPLDGRQPPFTIPGRWVGVVFK